MMTRAASPEGKNQVEARVLAIDFSPHPYSVICGRGNVGKNTPGNQHLQTVAVMHMPECSQAQSKSKKTLIISQIVGMVRALCPNGKGAFIKTETN
jgi:hypothetical protein